jgi:hypothetical protein
MYVVRQGSPERSRRAHHEREKVNKFNTPPFQATKALAKLKLKGAFFCLLDSGAAALSLDCVASMVLVAILFE